MPGAPSCPTGPAPRRAVAADHPFHRRGRHTVLGLLRRGPSPGRGAGGAGRGARGRAHPHAHAQRPGPGGQRAGDPGAPPLPLPLLCCLRPARTFDRLLEYGLCQRHLSGTAKPYTGTLGSCLARHGLGPAARPCSSSWAGTTTITRSPALNRTGLSFSSPVGRAPGRATVVVPQRFALASAFRAMCHDALLACRSGSPAPCQLSAVCCFGG